MTLSTNIRPEPYRPPTMDEIRRAREMYTEGFTVSRVLAATDMSLGTLYYWLDGGPRDEKGEPFSLAPYQRRVLEMALRRDPSGELVFRLVVLSEPKKSGKTFMAACLALWWAGHQPAQ